MHDDFKTEPIQGLPELPPEGEYILWQGRPNWWALAKESLALKWVMGYFAFLGVWRAIALMAERDVLTSLKGAIPFLILGAIVCGMLTAVAAVQALTTVYTITNRRVAMRIGAALTVTFNLPFSKIESADLDLRRSGTGTIALSISDSDVQLSYLTFWPHVRPWRMKRTEPALRCIPHAQHVARLLANAAATQVQTTRAVKPQTDQAVPVPAE